jgi:hypothetical protein
MFLKLFQEYWWKFIIQPYGHYFDLSGLILSSPSRLSEHPAFWKMMVFLPTFKLVLQLEELQQ